MWQRKWSYGINLGLMIVNVDEIVSLVSIDDIIEDYVKLDRRGVNKIGSCPFHDEKTSSFTVSRSKQIFKCFGCGKGGDVVSFIMEFKKCTYPEAIHHISSRVGVPVQYADGTNSEEYLAKCKLDKAEKDALLKEMAKIWTQIKPHSIKADHAYAGKTYTNDIIEKWQIKYYDKHILSHGKIDKEVLKSLGVVNLNESGRYYDSYYKRLIFPIKDVAGDIIGYTARAIDDKKPKYINSPDSLLYDKSKSVFGLYENQKSIREREFAYLVEGCTDVIMLDQQGVSNAVAVLGTALTFNQAKKISHFTDRICLLRDGDKAGVKAAERDLEILTKAQLQSVIVNLPEGEDPASYIVKVGLDTFKDYVDREGQDAIIWRIKRELGDKKDPYKQSVCTELASRILAMIESDTVKESYTKEIASLIGVTQKVLSDKIKEQLDSKLDKKNKLSPEQELSKAKFGLYQHHNRIYNWNNQVLSNYMIVPIFLVRNGDKSKRIFEIKNEDNFSICLSLDSDDITSLSQFRKGTEMHGNYVFEGQEREFIKLRKLIYSDMQKVYQLPHLGYINQSGVYAWGNGITTPEGEFIRVNDYGHVAYGQFNYYLPAFSKILTQELVQNSEDLDYERLFVYEKTEHSFHSWIEEFKDHFGDNAHIAIGFYAATIIKDYLQKKFNCFPILNLFGPAGSGKSTLSLALNCMFGQPISSVHCINATWSAFFRRPAQIANAISVYEEYSEKVEKERQEGLKSFYDGFGRPMAQKDTSNKTTSIPVLSSIVLVGQVLPTHDPALLSRCITVFFREVNSTQQAKLKLDKYFKRAKKGEYATITAEIHAKREALIEKFEELYEDNKLLIAQSFSKGKEPNTRVLMNYNVIITALCALFDVFGHTYKLTDILDDAIVRIQAQNQVNEGATELLEFWTIVSYLIDTKKIPGDFYIVESCDKIRITTGERETKEITWDHNKRLLYLKVSHVHKEYLISAKSQGLQRTLDANSIKYYLKINRSFIGEIAGKRNSFNNNVGRYWVFDLDQIPNIDINI
jgi:DNA primase